MEKLKSSPIITIDELATEINLSKRTTERVISSLKEKGIIEKDGSKKSGLWIVKE